MVAHADVLEAVSLVGVIEVELTKAYNTPGGKCRTYRKGDKNTDILGFFRTEPYYHNGKWVRDVHRLETGYYIIEYQFKKGEKKKACQELLNMISNEYPDLITKSQSKPNQNARNREIP